MESGKISMAKLFAQFIETTLKDFSQKVKCLPQVILNLSIQWVVLGLIVGFILWLGSLKHEPRKALLSSLNKSNLIFSF